MNRKRVLIAAAAFVLGFFAVVGVMAVAVFGYCTEAGRVCTIKGER